MSPVEQLTQVLRDQQTELSYIRQEKRENTKRLTELQAKEIEVLVGIQRTREVIENIAGEDV